MKLPYLSIGPCDISGVQRTWRSLGKTRELKPMPMALYDGDIDLITDFLSGFGVIYLLFKFIHDIQSSKIISNNYKL